MNEKKLTVQAASVGYTDPVSLRRLLIATTSTDTSEIAMSYFKTRFSDEGLLNALLPIALEGEDGGDAPWAPTNLIAEFPANLLNNHREALTTLSQEQWIYLKRPATVALAKISLSPDL